MAATDKIKDKLRFGNKETYQMHISRNIAHVMIALSRERANLSWIPVSKTRGCFSHIQI